MLVSTNLSSLSAQRMLFENTKAASTAMERLATGSKINKAQDDVAGSAIADRMTSQVRGLNMAVKNVNDAMAMLSVADSAARDITDMLQRMRELAIQAASDTNSAADRQYLQDEVDSLIQEIDRVATQTQYNGEKLLDGSNEGKIQVGAEAGQTVNFEFMSVNSLSLGFLSWNTFSSMSISFSTGFSNSEGDDSMPFSLNNGVKRGDIIQFRASNSSGNFASDAYEVSDTTGSTLNLSSGLSADDAALLNQNAYVSTGQSGVYVHVATSSSIGAASSSGGIPSELNLLSASSSSSALTTLSQAIDQVAAVRSEYGAMQNRLQFTISNLVSVSENTVAARSRIEDADFARESAVLAKSQILQQSGAAMLAQANARPQLVLRLIK